MDYLSKLETMSLQRSSYLSNIYEMVISFESEKRFRKLKDIKLKNTIEQRNTATAIKDKVFFLVRIAWLAKYSTPQTFLVLNPFVPNARFLSPPNTSENRTVF